MTSLSDVGAHAHSIEGERPKEAARLVQASRGALSSAEPVRVPVEARIRW
jgi:hypothetical protein